MARSRLLLSVVFATALLIAGAVGANLRNHLGTVETTFRMAVATAGAGQVFAHARSGYSETNSSSFPLEHGAGVQSYEVALHPDDPLDAIRLDPGSGEGIVRLESIEFSWRAKNAQLTGVDLREAVRPLHQIEAIPNDRGLSLKATGSDPSLEITIPEDIADAMELRAKSGLSIMVIAIIGLLWLSLSMRRDVATLARQSFRVGDWPLLLFAALSALILLSLLGYGCDGMCSPRGLWFGLLLLAGSLGMAIVGQVVLRQMGIDSRAGRPRVFLSLLTGQGCFVLYIAVRSAIHSWLPFLPITALELIVLVAAAAALLLRDALTPNNDALTIRSRNRDNGWLLIELALLAGVCLVIGERELPRLVMLSSDPDTHAYFARQLESSGGVPWRGGNAFHYPMGTAALGFLWAKLAFLDVRDAVTALPLLQAFFAALVLAEAFSLRIRNYGAVLLLFLTGLGVTAAGFLIPLYSEYAHMEGAGRQMAMATFALVPALLMSRRTAGEFAVAALMLLSLFVLGVLNPINLVLPLILLAGYGLHQLVVNRKIGWWGLVPAALLPLLLLDPLYFEWISGTGRPESRFTVDTALQSKPLSLVSSQWVDALGRGPGDFLAGNTSFLPGQSPAFITFVAILVAGLWGLQCSPLRRVLPRTVVAVFVLAALWAADALFDSLVDDRRFYLLAPYYWLGLAQAKILLVTSLLLAVALAFYRRRLSLIALFAFTAAATTSTAVAMHRTQDFMEKPRVNYCGSLGCIEADDLAVLREFEDLYVDGKLRPGRVLLPNSRHSAHREDWIFPVTAARAIPFFNTPPAAFFYYQGDSDFTTANYIAYVCDRFDREWLREQAIAYVFLPARRGAACMEGMESLPQSERVLVQRGNSMIVELH